MCVCVCVCLCVSANDTRQRLEYLSALKKQFHLIKHNAIRSSLSSLKYTRDVSSMQIPLIHLPSTVGVLGSVEATLRVFSGPSVVVTLLNAEFLL